MGIMPNSTQANGNGEERSANDEFMDQFADPDDDYEDDRPPRTTPGLLPGALIGAGLASLCAIGIYQLAGSGSDKAAPSPPTVTYTQDGPTRTVTEKSGTDDQAGDSTSTRTVTLPRETRTVRVVQPGKNKTVTQTVTKDGSAKTETKTETKTTTESAPAKTETTTVTHTATQTIGPPKHTGAEGQ